MKEPEKIYELDIVKIVPQGLGLGFAEKMTFFVPLAAQGDRLKVKINQLKGKTAFAEIVEIVEPSPDRTEPRCEYFGRCGGCDFQQLKYSAQLDAKLAMLKDCLTRLGKIKYGREIEIIPSPKPYEYRARAAWHADTRKRKIGYFRRHTHDVLDVEACPILSSELQNTLTELRGEIEWESFWGGKVEIEAANAGSEVSIYSDEIIEPTDDITFEAHGEKYLYSAHCFFQGNSSLVEKLIELAVGGASGGSAVDLYCGVGLFTLPLARKFETVAGIEGGEKAVEYANRNVEHARLENVSIHAQSVGEWLTENEAGLNNIDFLLLDPPRSGAEREIIESLLRCKPREIAYVSCEPSILARDLRMLIDGGYEIESMTAIDLFPQTHHIETVVRLKTEARA